MDKVEERNAAQQMIREIERLSANIGRRIRLMEVCGTHTVEIFRSGLRSMMPQNVELVSGPGCPVCVTGDDYIDKAIAYAKREDTIITTFGDMLKVPGSLSNLGEEKAKGADVRILYSPLDSLAVARDNPAKKVIFLAVGFETTAPTVGATVLAAREGNIRNQFFLTACKLVPPAIKALLADDEVHIDGFLLPGHVAVVTGAAYFNFLTRENMPAVVTGFTPLAILRGVCRLVKQIADHNAELANEYESVVSLEGSQGAKEVMEKVFRKVDATWRGMGIIEKSGLGLKDEFSGFDIEKQLPTEVKTMPRTSPCRCGDVLRGIISPPDCPLFKKACTPLTAVGPCMVSVEGVCAAWFKYGRDRFQ